MKFFYKTNLSALYAPAEQIVLWKSVAFAFALGLLPLNPHQEVRDQQQLEQYYLRSAEVRDQQQL